MARPALAVCWNDIKAIAPAIEPLVPSVFSRVTFGTKVEDFVAEASSTDPTVLAVGGSATHDVLKLFFERNADDRIRWIHSLNTGVDAYRLPELKSLLRDVPITNARGAFSSLLAEHVLLSMLYFNRTVWQLQANKRAKKWDRYPNVELRGQTLGIVGYGDIAKLCAQRAMAMGVNVQAFKRSVPAGDSEVDAHGVRCFGGESGLNTVLSTSDFVMAVLPSTADTRNFFTRERFAAMRPSTVFINIGRGLTVDESALLDALNSGAIRGAALDVTAVEPLPDDHPLWNLGDDKLLLTPHNADISTTAFLDAAKSFASYARDFVDTGSLPEYRIDVDKGY